MSHYRKYPEIKVGDRYGYLTVLAPATSVIQGSQTWRCWLCQCECGTEKIIKDACLKNGTVKSCGCLFQQTEFKEAARLRATRHGEGANGKETPEYISWCSLNKRSRNLRLKERSPWYADTKVCAGWRKYENFLGDLGRKPTSEHTIDRIDNKGHYSCGKCSECVANNWPMNGRWATQMEQARNRGDNHMLTLNGKTQCVVDWEIEAGLYRGCIENRLVRGEPEDERLLRSPKR